ncbi:hypothetical protein HRbin07_00120 [bacterium HR07]|nr:hypothetical protein HRbin07_00120 [bacterium HR07]
MTEEIKAPLLTVTVKIPEAGKVIEALAPAAMCTGGRPSETVTVIAPGLVLSRVRVPPTARRTAGRSGSSAPPDSRMATAAPAINPVWPSN